MKEITRQGLFEWDPLKEAHNLRKHKISFEIALLAFDDPSAVFKPDPLHSTQEPRWFCVGIVEGKAVTVRFTPRGYFIRILGAGYWRKGRKIYEKEKKEKMGF